MKGCGTTMKTSIMRILRHKYNISLRELAVAAKISLQYISMIELGVCPATDSTKAIVVTAFDGIIVSRTNVLSEFITDYTQNQDRLLEFVDDAASEGL